MIQSLSGDGGMNVQEFLSRVVNHNKPPTPSASTPYRQLKRHHSTQVSQLCITLNPNPYTWSVCVYFSSVQTLILLSLQPFDEGGRRIATPSAMTSTIGLRLFSTLDDGTGYTPVEYILDAWMDEGIENSSEILQVPYYTFPSNSHLKAVNLVNLNMQE